MLCPVGRREAQSCIHCLFDCRGSELCAGHLECLLVDVDEMLSHEPSIYEYGPGIYAGLIGWAWSGEAIARANRCRCGFGVGVRSPWLEI